MSRFSYVNGRYVPHGSATVSIEDRGFQFADGVYGAIALINGCFIDLEAHFDRLERSLGNLKISLSMSRRSLYLVMHELARRNRLKNGFLYMQVTRGVSHRDFKFPKNVKSTLVIILRPGSFGKIAVKKVITVPDIRWKRRDIKTTALIAQVLAKQTAVEKGVDDALLFDDRGFITEGASSNAWIIDKDDNVLTRPTTGAMILKGVTRNTLLRLCREKNIRVIERPFSVKEAYQAKEAFITGSTSLVVPVVEIDGHKIGNGKPGSLTSMLFKMYLTYANDQRLKQERWNKK